MNSRKEPALKGRAVLIIEDTPENLRLFSFILRMEGAKVFEADRAPKGITLAEAEQPDVILMDLNMPGMDGIAATRLLHESSRTSHIPIIVVTASVVDDDRLRAREAGCEGFIVKPVDPMGFGRQIAGFIRSSLEENQPRCNSITSLPRPV